jgi:hypothetical protein
MSGLAQSGLAKSGLAQEGWAQEGAGNSAVIGWLAFMGRPRSPVMAVDTDRPDCTSMVNSNLKL